MLHFFSQRRKFAGCNGPGGKGWVTGLTKGIKVMRALLITGCTLVAVLVFAAGCGGAKGSAKAGGKDATSSQLRKVDDTSRCELGEGRRETLVDLDRDDDPDVRKVYMKGAEGEVLVCREADLNFDGTKDLFVFYDADGQITRDEVDLDYDERIDIISTYASGKVIKQELDTNSDGVIDRVRYLENGLPVRLEGDTDGDRKVDYWEYYEQGRLVRIGQDKDGDGKADEWSRDDETEQAVLSGESEETPSSTEEEGETEGTGGDEAAEEETQEG